MELGPCIVLPPRSLYKGKQPSGRYRLQIDPRTGKKRGAHCLAWEAANGRDVPAGMVVMHLCDNPPCVNPGHLQLGTYKDNNDDCISKGRGNRNGRPGLSDEAAVSAMARMLVNEDRGQIAADLNTSRQALADLFCMRTKRVLFGYGSGG